MSESGSVAFQSGDALIKLAQISFRAYLPISDHLELAPKLTHFLFNLVKALTHLLPRLRDLGQCPFPDRARIRRFFDRRQARVDGVKAGHDPLLASAKPA